jgi:hypothetical protein
MAAQQKRFGKDSEKIKAWKAALSQVADLKGHHIDSGYVTILLLSLELLDVLLSLLHRTLHVH